MLSRQWPRPISRNASTQPHHVSMTTAAMTTPNVWTSAIATVTALRTVGILRSSSRSGRTGIARGVETIGREHLGEEVVRRHHRHGHVVIIHLMIATINRCNTATLPAVAAGDQGIRPFNARSLVLSVLLGLEPPVLPVRSLVAVGELFEHRPRHDAHGAVADGRRRRAVDRRRWATGSQGRLLERKAAQDIGRRPAPSRWDGAWWVAVVSVPRRSIADRRAFRTAHGQRPHGRAAGRHVDASGQPRRPRRRRRRWSSCAGR